VEQYKSVRIRVLVTKFQQGIIRKRKERSLKSLLFPGYITIISGERHDGYNFSIARDKSDPFLTFPSWNGTVFAALIIELYFYSLF
jgi:hypothetical protein